MQMHCHSFNSERFVNAIIIKILIQYVKKINIMILELKNYINKQSYAAKYTLFYKVKQTFNAKRIFLLGYDVMIYNRSQQYFKNI